MQLLILRADNVAAGLERGDIVEIRASNTTFSGAEPATFVILETTDPMASARAYANALWSTVITPSIVTSDLTTDTFTIQLTASNASSTLGAITQAQVQNFITGWGGVIGAIAANSVQFSIVIYNAIISPRFWGLSQAVLNQVLFSEVTYTQATETHRVQADYSAFNTNPTYIETLIENNGATIISHANNVIVFDITRAIVQAKFLKDIESNGSVIIRRFQYKIDTSAAPNDLVTQAEAAVGEILSTTLAAIQAALIDKTAL